MHGILLEVRKENDACLIAIQNPIEWNVEMDGTSFISSKQDKTVHGFGMKNIIRVVNGYHGKIDFFVTEDSFRVEIRFENRI